MKFKTLLLFGPPGSGKGTLGKALGDNSHFVHLSTGEIFRGLDMNSPKGKEVQGYTLQGKLVPDTLTLDIWKDYVDQLIQKGKFDPKRQILILDGIPRTKHQAEVLDQYIDVLAIVFLKINDVNALLERMKSRAKIENRNDDSDEGILRKRFLVYERETLVLLTHYPNHLVFELAADQSKEKVLEDAKILLKKIFKIS